MSGTKDQPKYAISEVAEQTGVSTRTVRYYVQRSLIEPPLGRGRGRHYSDQHIAQIIRVRRLQREGVPLDTIRRMGEHEGDAEPAIVPTQRPPDVVFRIALLPGVRLELDAKHRVPESPVIDSLIRACRRILSEKAEEIDASSSPEESNHRPDKGGEHEPS